MALKPQLTSLDWSEKKNNFSLQLVTTHKKHLTALLVLDGQPDACAFDEEASSTGTQHCCDRGVKSLGCEWLQAEQTISSASPLGFVRHPLDHEHSILGRIVQPCSIGNRKGGCFTQQSTQGYCLGTS